MTDDFDERAARLSAFYRTPPLPKPAPALPKDERESRLVKPAHDAPAFRQSDLADPAFYLEHRAEILAAQARGDIITRDDWKTEERPK